MSRPPSRKSSHSGWGEMGSDRPFPYAEVVTTDTVATADMHRMHTVHSRFTGGYVTTRYDDAPFYRRQVKWKVTLSTLQSTSGLEWRWFREDFLEEILQSFFNGYCYFFLSEYWNTNFVLLSTLSDCFCCLSWVALKRNMLTTVFLSMTTIHVTEYLPGHMNALNKHSGSTLGLCLHLGTQLPNKPRISGPQLMF